MIQVITAIISAISLIVVAAIGRKSDKNQKSSEAYREERVKLEEIRAKENYLEMKVQIAALDLAYVTSLAVTGGHTNGNVEAAQEKAIAAKGEYYDFINRTYSEEIYKN